MTLFSVLFLLVSFALALLSLSAHFLQLREIVCVHVFSLFLLGKHLRCRCCRCRRRRRLNSNHKKRRRVVTAAFIIDTIEWMNNFMLYTSVWIPNAGIVNELYWKSQKRIQCVHSTWICVYFYIHYGIGRACDRTRKSSKPGTISVFFFKHAHNELHIVAYLNRFNFQQYGR